MKSEIRSISEVEFFALFPIEGSVPGWRFNIEELSAGAYECRGGDRWGRLVSRQGSDPEALLQQCEQDVREISSSHKPGA